MKEDSFEIVIHIYGGRSLVLRRWVALALMFQVSVRYLGPDLCPPGLDFTDLYYAVPSPVLVLSLSSSSSLSPFLFSLFLPFSPFFLLLFFLLTIDQKTVVAGVLRAGKWDPD